MSHITFLKALARKVATMLYKRYGKTGKEISAIGFGGMRFANPEDIDANARIVLHAYRRGINYFDTAPSYCKDKSEEIIGAAVKRMDRRRIYVSTKSMESDGKKLRGNLERSLKRLNVDRIDFFHIWCVVTMDAWKERKAGGAVAAAQKAREEGLISHLAVSSHLSGGDLRKVLEEGIFEGATLGYCALNFPYRQEAIDAAGKMKLGVVTMNPLGGGLIPKHAKRFDFIRSPKDPSVVAAALRFNVSQPAVTCALVGFTTIEHVDEAVAAIDNFQPHDARRIRAMREKILDSFEGFCTGCGYCLPCPEGIDVPRMMDAYNLAILRGKIQAAADRLNWHWDLTPADAKACSLCGACEERCTQHLPIRDRLKEIAGIPSEKPK
jgi:hypothetical protein